MSAAILSALDRNISPCDDFYQVRMRGNCTPSLAETCRWLHVLQFSCGSWLAQTKIPADKNQVYLVSSIETNNQNTLRRILEGVYLLLCSRVSCLLLEWPARPAAVAAHLATLQRVHEPGRNRRAGRAADSGRASQHQRHHLGPFKH